jgi:hypothetical protein
MKAWEIRISFMAENEDRVAWLAETMRALLAAIDAESVCVELDEVDP